jgi:hypothetical protein
LTENVSTQDGLGDTNLLDWVSGNKIAMGQIAIGGKMPKEKEWRNEDSTKIAEK